ncbi:MAG: hypothetical protein JWO82_1631 [Akkermansiaceae bacterium]|nr:hypothetical protein [Akkermansiaceae bacterium]
MRSLLRLPSRKSLRRTGWTLATLVTLTCLTYAVINWRGARMKRDALARLRATGALLDAGALPAMPPDAENYAMIPLLRETVTTGHGRNRSELQSADSRLAALYNRDLEKIRKPLSPVPDFSRLPVKSPYGQSAPAFVEAYDRLNATALEELRGALPRPFSQRALNSEDSSRSDLSVIDFHGARISLAMKGLLLRAVAALEIKDSPRAVESILIWHRLAEVLCSRGTLVPLMAEGRDPLRRGIRGHLFTRADLLQLQDAFRRADYRQRTLASLHLRALDFQLWSRWKEQPDLYSQTFASYIVNDPDPLWHWLQSHAVLLPDGFFDASAAHWADGLGEMVRSAGTPGPLAGWWAAAREPAGAKGEWQWNYELWLPRYAMVRGMQGSVVQSLNLLACDLERYYLEHGSYPDTLEPFERQSTLDPLTAQPLCYARDGDGFRLYSVGPDGIDQGGGNSPPGDWYNSPDWVW